MLMVAPTPPVGVFGAPALLNLHPDATTTSSTACSSSAAVCAASWANAPPLAAVSDTANASGVLRKTPRR